MNYRVNVKSTPQVVLPGIPAGQMASFGEHAIAVEGRRILRGMNIYDEAAAPLTRGYARRKQRAGQPPIRNLRLTGALLAARVVTRAEDGKVRVGFGTQPEQRIKAHTNQEREPQFGLSPLDKHEVAAEMRNEYGFRFHEANRR